MPAAFWNLDRSRFANHLGSNHLASAAYAPWHLKPDKSRSGQVPAHVQRCSAVVTENRVLTGEEVAKCEVHSDAEIAKEFAVSRNTGN
jgi:hypothetical protein